MVTARTGQLRDGPELPCRLVASSSGAGDAGFLYLTRPGGSVYHLVSHWSGTRPLKPHCKAGNVCVPTACWMTGAGGAVPLSWL